MCLSRDDSLSKTTPKLRADGDACTTDPPNEIELTRGLGLYLELEFRISRANSSCIMSAIFVS